MVRDVDLFVKEEESFRVNGPMWRWGVELDGCDGVRLEQGLDIRVEFLGVHNDYSTEDGDGEECWPEG